MGIVVLMLTVSCSFQLLVFRVGYLKEDSGYTCYWEIILLFATEMLDCEIRKCSIFFLK